MFRKFVTLCLFTTAVPFAVFGQDTFGQDDVKMLMSSMPAVIREHWPTAKEELVHTLPKGVDSLAASFNKVDPSAGPTADGMCVSHKNIQKNDSVSSISSDNFSI